jgi:prophage tail gpP-like protein
MPKPEETAVLEVNDKKFEDWESVWVEKHRADSFTHFRFTATERDPIFGVKNSFPLAEKLQFKPGDKCKITLAGVQVIDGIIETRQVAYDAHQHGVMLIGKSVTAWAARSSVDSKTGNFDKKNIMQVAQEVLSPYGIGLKIIGAVNMTPFTKLQCEPGERVWDFLERIARPRGVILGSDAFGNFILQGQHSDPGGAELIEGRNIKSCQCTINHSQSYFNYDATAQKAGEGTDASEQHATVKGTVTQVPSKLITPVPQPVETSAEVQQHAQTTKVWGDDSVLNAIITVQGWLADDQHLWEENKEYFVRSPMAMLNQTLKTFSVTLTQDNQNGTQTILNMVLPGLLNGSPNYDATPTGAPPTNVQPGQGTITIRPVPPGQ